MSRIASMFKKLQGKKEKALIAYITAGDPDMATTEQLLKCLVESGADMIELGVPFSDPMADGPTIQRASERALAKGMSLTGVMEIVRSFRKENTETSLVLMGYANPIEAYGVEKFAQDAHRAGVDGVLTVDYPPEECVGFASTLKREGLDPIFLLAPTSTDSRFAQVAELGSGYIYYVSLKGVTGAGHLDLDEVTSRIPAIRAKVGMPVGVGFGIRDGASAARIATVADGVVIGSRIIEEIESSFPGEAPARVEAFMRGIREAMDKGRPS